MWSIANPANFSRLAARLIPWMGGLTLVCFVLGLYLSFTAPADYQQGETVRIMYIHVPAAWLGSFIYFSMVLSALGTLVWRHPLADAAQKAAAPLGAGFTLICLVTGSLWGRPMWGTYWVWDARLTSVLILFIIYLGLIACGKPLRTRPAPRALPPFSPLWGRSICRLLNFRWIGGIRCTSLPRCFAWAGPPLTPRC